MSERLNKIISLIGQYDHEEDNYIQVALKEEIFDNHVWWLVEQMQQLESENEQLVKDLLKERKLTDGMSERFTNAVEENTQLESENEKLINVLKTCEECNGYGEITTSTPNGHPYNLMCEECEGIGYIDSGNLIEQLESENEKFRKRVIILEQRNERISNSAIQTQSQNERLQKNIQLAKDALEPYAENELVQTAFKYLRDTK